MLSAQVERYQEGDLCIVLRNEPDSAPLWAGETVKIERVINDANGEWYEVTLAGPALHARQRQEWLRETWGIAADSMRRVSPAPRQPTVRASILSGRQRLLDV